MGITRTMLRPLARGTAILLGTKVRAFLRAHQQTQTVQDRLLAQLLERHKSTAFARDHGLESVRSYEELVRAIPVSDYQTHRPYMDRVLAGEHSSLLPDDEQVLMFSMTSGTTGLPKHIPVTSTFAAHMKRTFSIFGYRAIFDHKAVWLRSILAISSPMREKDGPAGHPCGAISGLLQAEQLNVVRRMYAAPAEVTSISDPATKYYALLRCSIGRDVSFITTANPSSTIKLIESGQHHTERLIRDVADGTMTPPRPLEESIEPIFRFKPNRALARRLEEGVRQDGQLLPRHFWNVTFLANWTGGTLKLYLPRLRELFDDAPIRDIGLIASEGRFSIPLDDNTPAGVAEITGNFLEFIPAENHSDTNPHTLRAHELEIGGEYFLVVTNYAGLWRYNLDDRVRVVDYFGQSPVFEFLCRGKSTANITGEKITEHQVVEAMKQASAATGATVERFVVQGRFAATPFYELRAEIDGRGDLGVLADAFDRALARLNLEYASKRISGRLDAVHPVSLPTGTLEQAEQETIRLRRGRSEQYKHQYLLTDVLTGPAAETGSA